LQIFMAMAVIAFMQQDNLGNSRQSSGSGAQQRVRFALARERLAQAAARVWAAS
jgi:hypothetical protein